MDAAGTKPFNRDAQARIVDLFRACPPAEFFAELDSYAPRSRVERVAFYKFKGYGLYDIGEYKECRPQLSRALRLSDVRSHDRSLLRGILADTYIRLGQFDRGESLTQRALDEGCASDPGGFLEGAHRATLGRVQVLRGTLESAVQNYEQALGLLNENSPTWISILTGIALAHFHRGDIRGAEAAIEKARRSPGGAKERGWALVSVECPLAIDSGDIDRAGAVVEHAMGHFFDQNNEKVQQFLNEMRACVFNARGRPREAELLARGVMVRAEVGGRHSDTFASGSRVLAESLMAQDRFEEAMEALRPAVRVARRDDHAEWVLALRRKAECLEALGDRRRLRRTIDAARAVHEGREFTIERTHLERFATRVERRGHSSLAGVSSVASPMTVRAKRLLLRSGRTFITTDAALLDAVISASLTDLPVLIEGETGTGKELVASLIHELGGAAGRPFVVVDCSALPETLADAELFGAARGAYTDASHERAGLIAHADGGTVFLDELPELSSRLQAKLLRVVQEGSYRRLGEDVQRTAGVRFIASTNQPVGRLLRTAALRQDLFYRLSGHRISIPPLRARPNDIGPIATEVAERCGCVGLTWDALERLETIDWPGNVRQLEMTVRLAASQCRPGALLQWADLEPHLAPLDRPADDAPVSTEPRRSLRANRLAAERALLAQALAENDGVISRAARSLGISRQAFYKAMRRSGIDSPDRDLL